MFLKLTILPCVLCKCTRAHGDFGMHLYAVCVIGGLNNICACM